MTAPLILFLFLNGPTPVSYLVFYRTNPNLLVLWSISLTSDLYISSDLKKGTNPWTLGLKCVALPNGSLASLILKVSGSLELGDS